jgi:hypothetical protein
MKVMIPINITHAQYFEYPPLVDFDEWDALTPYVVGNRVVVDALKSEFECVVNNTGTAPTLTMTTPWVKTGSSKAWRPFDRTSSTQVTSTYDVPLIYPLWGIGRWNAIYILNVDASHIRVTHYRPDGPFSVTYGLLDTTPIIDAWTYCFGQPAMRRSFILSGWDGWGSDTNDLNVEIEIYREGGIDPIGVGEILIGPTFTLGDCHAEPTKRLVDYSKKEVNQFGEVVFVERAYAYEASYDVQIATNQRSFIENLVERLRATPAVYFPSTSTLELAIYGFPSSFEITYATPEIAHASLDIEGVT